MSILKRIFTAASLLALSAAVLLAAPSVPSKKQGFENYALLRTRNIFDPDRQPGAVNNAPSASQTPTPPTTRADYAALTGIMITADKALAFFSGSRPEFNAVLATSGTIAGAVVTRITPDSVEVERDGKRIVIAVGQTVPLDASSVPGSAPANISPLSASPTANAASTPAPASVDRETLIRRMMEKRQQELK